MRLLDSVLLPAMSGAELFDQGQRLRLPAEEEALVTGAVEKRCRDFALGRTCAHAALAAIGRDDAPIPKGRNGAPVWPDGIIGSITHTDAFAAAIVARAGDFAGLGLDAERLGGVTADLWLRLFGPAERDYLSRQAEADRLATVMFSAKEACHKAGKEKVLRFHDLEVFLTSNSFTGRRGAEVFHGRYAIKDSLVLTLAWRGAS